MAKQDLLNKILGDAEARAKEIKSEAEIKADAMRAAAEEERATLIEGVRKLSSATAPDTLKRARSMADLEVKKILLSVKQDVLAKAYEKAADALIKGAQYQALLASMIASAAEKGDVVVFSTSDKGKVNIAKVLRAVKEKTGLDLKAAEEYGAFRGGIVLRGQACDKNLTLEVELEALRSTGKMKYDTLFD